MTGRTVVDILTEAIRQVAERPGRSIPAGLGVALGIASLVATVGLASTANQEVLTTFSALAPRDVLVEARVDHRGQWPFPVDAEERLLVGEGTVAVGTAVNITDPGPVRPTIRPDLPGALDLPVIGASPGLLRTAGARFFAGRGFEDIHDERGFGVAIVGASAANQLGIGALDVSVTILIGRHRYVIMGIIGETGRQPELLSSVLIPLGLARDRYPGSLARPRIIVETMSGVASAVAERAPYLLIPTRPESLVASVAPEPTRTRDAVRSDLRALLVSLGALGLLVATAVIGNILLMSILERVGEIGLRRALGATRREIGAIFLTGSGLLGLLGGCLGVSMGVTALSAIATWRGWRPVVPVWLLIAGLGAGVAVGLLAGLYPAVRAARLEPVEAFRYGVS